MEPLKSYAKCCIEEYEGVFVRRSSLVLIIDLEGAVAPKG